MIRGDRLRELRKNKGMSQEELANLVGVSKSSISCYEKGTRTPSLETILDFMHLFAVTSNYLIGCDNLIEITDEDNSVSYTTLSNEEIIFLEELKKNKLISNLILDDPKRTADLVKKKIG